MSEINKTDKDTVGENAESTFIETREYRLFAEFCDACYRYRYIGLCFGPPGVGKTLSAIHYANSRSSSDSPNPSKSQTVLYTAPVVNTPGIVEREIVVKRRTLHNVVLEPLRREEEAAFEAARQEEFQREKEKKEHLLQHDWLAGPLPELPRIGPTFSELSRKFEEMRRQIPDPTNLVLIDEADRLKMASLEATRAVFDKGGIGLVLIGMPGMEKRLARYPQFYSRIGFVHQFRPLGAQDIRSLLSEGWSPPGVQLPPLDDEAVTTIIRITGGNFRLLDRLLSQAERIAQINHLQAVTRQVVETARESLVIGQF